MPKQSLTERVSQHDREIAAIRKLVLTGMKMLIRLEKAQERTEQTLERFIRSLERGSGNGQGKTRVQ
jgi:hypothetical protein